MSVAMSNLRAAWWRLVAEINWALAEAFYAMAEGCWAVYKTLHGFGMESINHSTAEREATLQALIEENLQ